MVFRAAELEIPLLGGRAWKSWYMGGALRLECSWGRKGAGEHSRRAQDSSRAGERGAAQATDTPACLPHCTPHPGPSGPARESSLE